MGKDERLTKRKGEKKEGEEKEGERGEEFLLEAFQRD